MHDTANAAPSAEAARVSETLARIRTGVRQQHAWTATRSETSGDGPVALLQVRAAQTLEQPIPTSHRGVIGQPIVFAKKVVYRLFMKWYLRSIVEQQNAFNRSVTAALQDLYDRQRIITESLIDASPDGRGGSAAR